MLIDRTFKNEVEEIANGDGSREYGFAFLKEIKEVSEALSHRYEFDRTVKKYGRAKVALCVAATFKEHDYRMTTQQLLWALTVIGLWGNKVPERSLLAATVNIEPSILSQNSYGFRLLTCGD